LVRSYGIDASYCVEAVHYGIPGHVLPAGSELRRAGAAEVELAKGTKVFLEVSMMRPEAFRNTRNSRENR